MERTSLRPMSSMASTCSAMGSPLLHGADFVEAHRDTPTGTGRTPSPLLHGADFVEAGHLAGAPWRARLHLRSFIERTSLRLAFHHLMPTGQPGDLRSFVERTSLRLAFHHLMPTGQPGDLRSFVERTSLRRLARLPRNRHRHHLRSCMGRTSLRRLPGSEEPVDTVGLRSFVARTSLGHAGSALKLVPSLGEPRS